MRGATVDNTYYSSKYHLGNVLVCEECGSPYRRRTWVVSGKKKVVWVCKTRLDKDGRSKCPISPTLDEITLHQAILKALKKVLLGADAASDDKLTEQEVKSISEQEEKLQQLKNKADSCMDSDVDEAYLNQLMDEISIAELDLAYIKFNAGASKSLKQTLDTNEINLSCYSDDLVRDFIDKIFVSKKGKLKVKLKNNTQVII